MSRVKFPNIDTLLEGSAPTTIFHDVTKSLRAADDLRVYGKEYLIESGLYTANELRGIKTSIPDNDNSDEAHLRHQIVGYER